MINCELMDPVDALHLVADIKGFDEQSLKFIEEMGECIAALSKYRIVKKTGTTEGRLVCFENLVEEIADVWNMMVQMIYLLDCDATVEEVANEKICRQLNRMRAAGLIENVPVEMVPLLKTFMRDSLV